MVIICSLPKQQFSDLEVRYNGIFFFLSVFRTRIRSYKSYGEFVTDYLSIIMLISGMCEHLLSCRTTTLMLKLINQNSNRGFFPWPNSVRFIKGHPIFSSSWCALVVVDFFSQVNLLLSEMKQRCIATLLLKSCAVGNSIYFSPAVLFIVFSSLRNHLDVSCMCYFSFRFCLLG